MSRGECLGKKLIKANTHKLAYMSHYENFYAASSARGSGIFFNRLMCMNPKNAYSDKTEQVARC